MPIEFLRKVADAELPLSVADESEVDKVRVLAAAGMITAAVPEPGGYGPAQIHAVTGLGRATLKVARGANPALSGASVRRPGLPRQRGAGRLPA